MWGSREQSEVIHGCTSGTPLEEGGAVRRCNHDVARGASVAECYRAKGLV